MPVERRDPTITITISGEHFHFDGPREDLEKLLATVGGYLDRAVTSDLGRAVLTLLRDDPLTLAAMIADLKAAWGGLAPRKDSGQ